MKTYMLKYRINGKVETERITAYRQPLAKSELCMDKGILQRDIISCRQENKDTKESNK